MDPTNMSRLKTTECRIGVVGLYNSGKTVLLTSLINHLQDHDPARFALGSAGTTSRKFRRVPADRGWAEFNYAGHRDALVHHGKWPRKTTDRAQFNFQFERSDWLISDALVKLYDLPGERVADAAMLGRDFAAWSAHVLALLRDDTHYRVCCEEFLKAIDSGSGDEAEILAAYRLALANLILAYKPMISPSTFLVDIDGGVAGRATAGELAASRSAGLGADDQFAPLPPGRADLAAAFSERFERYKRAVVAPHVAALRSCHGLLVLADVTMILSAGVGMYDDTRQILRDLLDVLDPGETPIDAVLRHLGYALLPYQLRPGGIRRVVFAAPKADLVHPDDRDKMVSLLRHMVEKSVRDRDGLRAEYLNCSAVVSTRALPAERGRRALVGVPLRDATGKRIPPGEEQKFSVPELPDDWPADWRAGAFVFPEVYPRVPPRRDHAPDQVNLDRIFNGLIG